MSAPRRLRALSLALVFAAPSAAVAQTSNAAPAPIDRALAGFRFREIGPAVMGGRVADIAADESNPSTFYIGFATGGVWKTTSQGMSWTPVFDHESTGSIGDVTLAPSNPNVVWVGTGEPQNRQSSPWGDGVFRSMDGGRTWQHLGLEETRHIGRIVVHPRNPDIAWVAAVGHLFGPNEERGVYKTMDGGKSWSKVLYIDENTGAIDLAMDPGDPNTLFAAMYQRRRTPWGFSASGGGGGLYRTLDGGATWKRLENGLPKGEIGRIGVDVYRRDGNRVMALVEADRQEQGVYLSLDRGESWEKLAEFDPRPMYFSQVRIDPNDPERIWAGGVSLQVSEDGGRTWNRDDAAPGIHVDHHAIWIDPNDSDHLIIGNDGGVASTFDRGATWRHHNNLAVGQFYAIGVDMRDPYYVCGGLQDNSSWCGPSESVSTYGIRNADWFDVSGGDGFYNKVDPSDPNIIYTESQGGNVSRYQVDTGESARIRPVRRPTDADTTSNFRWNWSTPIHISHADPATVYLGANVLLRSRDRGMSWEVASPDLTRHVDRDTLRIMGRRVTQQTLSRNDGVSSYGTITVIGESPLDANVIYTGTDDGMLQVTRDGGSTWTDISANVKGIGTPLSPGSERSRAPDLVHGMVVTGIEPSHHVAGRVYLSINGHYLDDFGAYVYASEDFGQTWRPITAGLPAWSVNVIREHPRTPGLLFAGNEIGVFVSTDRGAAWHRMQGLPTVPVDDIVLHPRENDLVLGTHGRSIWILDDVAPLEEITRGRSGAVTDAAAGGPRAGALAGAARASGDVLAQPMHLFGARPATIRSRAGAWPFWGDLYAAPNPPDGVRLRYWLEHDRVPADSVTRTRSAAPGGGGRGGAPGNTTAADTPTVKMAVLDARGNVLRTIDGPATAGLHEIVWDFRTDPPFVPEPGAQTGGRGGFGGAPRGIRVMPGTYTVRLGDGDDAQTTDVQVRLDPRIEVGNADLRARQNALLDITALARPAYEAGLALTTADAQVHAIQDLIGGHDDADHALANEADSLAAHLQDARQTLNRANAGARLSGALEGMTARPTDDQLWQIRQGWERLPVAIETINTLTGRDLVSLIARVYQPAARPPVIAPVEPPRRPAR